MSKIEHKEIKIDFQIKSIELLKGSINLPSTPDVSLTNFTFNINLENKADPSSKMLFVIVTVEIMSEDQNHILGSLVASCIYEVANFEEIIKIEENGRLNIPQQISEIFNSISISTTRGMMFSTFKGTFLHNAILPIIDPRSFKSNVIAG